MSAIGNTGTSSEVKEQYENMKKFVGGVSYFSPSPFAKTERW